jgi:putative tryptophan/tyrosine transport system substrate-binding protein
VIVAVGTPAALAAKDATTTIPIVFGTGGDPVALGLVASLNRPGANLTGIAILTGEIAPKRLQLLRELTPNAAVFGVLADPAFPVTQSTIADLHAAARTLGRQLVVVMLGLGRGPSGAHRGGPRAMGQLRRYPRTERRVALLDR